MRSGPTPALAAPAARVAGGRTRTTTTPAEPWKGGATIAWFLAQLRLPAGISFGYDLDPDTRQPTASTFSAPDGSWARVSLTDNTVTEAGDTPLWTHVEWAHDQWTTAGQPPWHRLGLTVTRDDAHRLWVDDPASGRHWRLRGQNPDLPG